VQQLVGGVVGFDVEVGEASFEESVGAADGVGAAEVGLEVHGAPVQFLCVGIVADGLVEGGQGGV